MMRRVSVAFGLMAMQSVWGPPFWGGGGGSSVPTGAIVLIDTGACPQGYTEDAISGHMLRATVAANGDVGTTGGSDAITPAGTNSTSTVTPNGTIGSATISWPVGVPTFAGSSGTIPAETITWPAGVPTFAGTAFSSVINHTHTINITDNGHVHTLNVQGGTTAATTGTHIMTSTATGGSARAVTSGDAVVSATTGITATSSNPAGGVSSITPAGTIAWPAGVPTNGTASFTPAGTIAWPAGVPTVSTPSFTGSGSTVSAQTFTGTQFDNRAAYIQVIACKKNASEPSPLPLILGATGAILMVGGRRT